MHKNNTLHDYVFNHQYYSFLTTGKNFFNLEDLKYLIRKLICVIKQVITINKMKSIFIFVSEHTLCTKEFQNSIDIH